MSQVPAVSSSETETQAPLEFHSETLQDLDVGSDESANVKGGGAIGAVGAAPSPVNPGAIRMTGGTSVILPGQ